VNEPLREYLSDPNYYRLRYQLAAQHANLAATSDDRSQRERAIDSAASLGHQTEQVLDSLTRLPKPLEVRQQRLLRFLAATVEPCAALIVAGLSVTPSDVAPLQSYLRPKVRLEIRRRHSWSSATFEPIPWSYRALYNLACCEAGRLHADLEPSRLDAPTLSAMTGVPAGTRSREDSLAMWALRHAVRTAPPGNERRELVRWAQADPSLDPVKTRYEARFEQILAIYSMPEPPAAAPLEAPWSRVDA
jgi:hypothetical protein